MGGGVLFSGTVGGIFSFPFGGKGLDLFESEFA